MIMACVENIPPPNAESEMEEGEIVDDLSDISSEEEFLLRQRLQVLENYNNVLERKKAKRSFIGPGAKHKKEDVLPYDLSEISATELEDYYSHAPPRPVKVQKRQKIHHRQKRKKVEPTVNPLKRKKNHHTKKKSEVKIISETSDESEDEYRNRRRKLADAVVVNTSKNDKTSLTERLQKMLCGVNPEPMKDTASEDKNKIHANKKVEQSELSPISSLNTDDHNIFDSETQENVPPKTNQPETCELIDLCTDEDSKTIPVDEQQDSVDGVHKNLNIEDLKKISDRENISERDSDEDLELLRQHALKTKTTKSNDNQKPDDMQTENKILSEDEDSDTTELRLICLKSALLKKAIEMKQKQRLRKKLSQSGLLDSHRHSDNNTDIESVDMDIGSDAEDKNKENPDGAKMNTIIEQGSEEDKALEKDIPKVPDIDELEDDEDLLRAKLLTSLSKNLPHLVNPTVIESIDRVKSTRPISPKPPLPAKPVVPAVVPEEKRFIITLGESDSEGEHEATKNLTKMHMKLSEQKDFQQRLDMFLKCTRMEVEKTTLPDVIQQPALKKNEKFVAKAVKHLPKSEQIEYKNLVKRMAELEKMKQARQATINLSNKESLPVKETLKPRNTSVDATQLSAINSLEEKIKASRKHIAEESAKMLKLKEEGVKLSQKYKIVATELRNIKTAIALNKKQTRSVQNCLTKIRLHHQTLLKSSISSSHSNMNGNMPLNRINTRLQKENNPIIEQNKTPVVNNPVKAVIESNAITEKNRIEKNINPAVQKPAKENNAIREDNKKDESKDECKDSVLNTPARVTLSNPDKEGHQNIIVHVPTKDEHKKPIAQKPAKDTNRAKEENRNVVVKDVPLKVQHPRLSIELDVTSNKKVVKMPGVTDSSDKNKLNLEIRHRHEDLLEHKRLSSYPLVEKGGGNREAEFDRSRHKNDDYKSPLDAFGSSFWEGDPNAILCPFEVGGDCKDADCNYLHTQFRNT